MTGGRKKPPLAVELTRNGVHVHVDEWHRVEQLGTMSLHSRLVALCTRSADARGGLVAALDQLIDEFSPEGSGSEDLGERPHVWHMLMRMHEGRRSDVRMAARVAPAVLGDPEDFEARCRRCEGRIRQALKEGGSPSAQGAARAAPPER